MKPLWMMQIKNGLGLILLRTRICKVCWLLALFLMATADTVSAIDFTFRTNSDNTITITEYIFYGGTTVLIPLTIAGKTVTRIGNGVFDGCRSVANVTIPNSVTNIGDWAFYGCTNLASITIPDSITRIGDWAFHGCRSLTSVTIPIRISSIGYGVFSQCGLTSITIPASVTRIGDWAFYGCGNLTSVYFQGNAPSLNRSVFRNANNTTVYYLPGTTGCESTLGGRPTQLWNHR